MKSRLRIFVLGLMTIVLASSITPLYAEPKAIQTGTATLLSPPQPLIDFSLVDTSNSPFTLASLKGQWTVLFFGYAQCPEICPQTLSLVAETWRSFPPQESPRFVFISLNPQADTIDGLKKFLANFNPSFIGVTGEEAQIKKLTQVCRIYSWTDPNLNAAGQKIIDHSATLLLINPQGQIKALFSPPHHTLTLARELKVLMEPQN